MKNTENRVLAYMEGLNKKTVENSTLEGEGGGQQGSFSTFIFFIFMLQMA